MLPDDRVDRVLDRQRACRWCGIRPAGVDERVELIMGLGLCQACFDRMDAELGRAPGDDDDSFANYPSPSPEATVRAQQGERP
jgi:hypothetical protein